MMTVSCKENEENYMSFYSARDYAKMDEVADAIRKRLQGFDTEIETLQARVSTLEAQVQALSKEPRVPLRAKLREKGIK